MEQQPSDTQISDETAAGTQQRKPWHAPQLITVSIVGLTEHMGLTGSDGGGTSTLS